MGQTVRSEIRSECPREVGRSVVAEQVRAMDDLRTIHTGARPGQVERLGHVTGLHRGAEQPGQDEARVVVEHGQEGVPAPADHLQVGDVSLPELVRAVRQMGKPRCSRQDDVGGAGDQIVSLGGCGRRSIPRERSPLSVPELAGSDVGWYVG